MASRPSARRTGRSSIPLSGNKLLTAALDKLGAKVATDRRRLATGGNRRGSSASPHRPCSRSWYEAWLRQCADLQADAGGLGGGLDHFACRRIANERAGPSRRDLAQADLEKAGQDEFADATRMDGAEEQVLQRRIDAGSGLPRDFVLFRDEIDQRRFGQGLL